MADINYEELEDLTLTMEDEDGTTTECELQFVFEYDGPVSYTHLSKHSAKRHLYSFHKMLHSRIVTQD